MWGNNMKLKNSVKYVLLYAVLLSIGYFSVNKIYDTLLIQRSFENYKTIDTSRLVYDDSMFTGEFIPSLEQEGLRVLVERTNNPKLAMILSSGIYRIDLYDGIDFKLSFYVDYQFTFSQIVDIPMESVFDYDSILITPLTEKNHKLVFVSPIQNNSDVENFESLNWQSYMSSIEGSIYNLNPRRDMIQGITVNLVDYNEDSVTLNIRNVSGSNIQLFNFYEEGKDVYSELSLDAIPSSEFEEDHLVTIQYSNLNFEDDYVVSYKYEEYDTMLEVNVSLLSNANPHILEESGIINPNLGIYKDYFDENNKVLSLIKDQTIIDQVVVIPAGYIVSLTEGQSITLTNDAFIRSYSPLDFKGTEENPIRISAEGESQSGIAIIQAETPSNIEYTIFDNLTNILHFAYHTTGALNFYESDVNISNSTISNNRSEDGLNVVRSHFDVSKSTFFNTYSDAFDSDFSTGYLTDSHFYNTGNDAFDCSGSNVEIANIDFTEIGDKALSIGEATTIKGTNLSLDTMDLGIAIKDSAHATFDTIIFKDTYLSFIQYNKKPVFGVSTTNITNATFSGDIGLYYLIQEHEHLIIDGEVYVPENLSKSEQIFDALINERPIR